MADHTDIRLETTGGTVIAYLAPNAETTPVLDNDLFTAQPARGDPSIVRDVQKISFEITAQGAFEESSALPSAHKNDLENLFGKSPVSAMDQINRVVHYLHDPAEGGPFRFYWRGNTFTATSQSAVDFSAGTYPVVSVSQFRPPTKGGFKRGEYTIKMTVGLPRRS